MLHIERRDSTRIVYVCRGTGCVSNGATEVYEALKKQVAEHKVKDVTVDFTGCHGFCQRGPILDIGQEHVFYAEVKPDDVPEIVQSHLIRGQVVSRLLYRNPATGETLIHSYDIPFYSRQQRLILRNCGHINPERIDDYFSMGGYEALKKTLNQMTPEQVIDEVKRSGLRGRGGAGFPTWQKWNVCRKAPGAEKYLICNADEGDPGAFMDRSVLEADPHSVLEGMLIAAYAIGANHGYIYVRAEYPLAVNRFAIAIEEARKHGFLGQNILGRGFSFDIVLKEGAGAFVCGEETALIASIEGKRGMPKPRPPYPAISGVWGKPTVINNVKTLASVPVILSRGAEWYSSIGTEKSKGTVVFAMTGKVANCGLVEVPMGTTLRELVFEIGGGISGGKALKAVQTGGPSGGCLPATFLDTPVDYESLTAAGSMMGSGGMVVLDNDTCMVDLAKYFLSFTQAESCGKCVPCRVGTRQMLAILDCITKGQGKTGDIEEIERLAVTIKEGSLCGLGRTAPNPVLTTLKYFRDEYEAHVSRRQCPALSCRDLIVFYIIPDKCQGCMICARNCPVGAIKGGKRLVHIIDQEKCVKCGICSDVCPKKFGAVSKVSGTKIDVPSEPIPVVMGQNT